ncbi:vitamin K epoxide reductase family protein [Flexivirga sp. ID2601S]|uniref:Vitamin K epoxide reductase family protein n=1 Tax=Flexivirga aerilata TaxID=1656889 RepID=A0A849AMK5_9MICO|nr:vitamin K epoxide reductase family protein [Flexivirga aerilata]
MTALSQASQISHRALGWILTVCGAVGLTAAGILSIEKYRLLTNPFYAPSCNVNAAINCGTVMQSDQAAAFGFPNPYIGLVGFAVVLTIGVGVLSGARFSRWFWWGLATGVAAGLAFVGWLAVQSIVVIEALCPYCMAVWAVMLVLAGTMIRVVVRGPGVS